MWAFPESQVSATKSGTERFEEMRPEGNVRAFVNLKKGELERFAFAWKRGSGSLPYSPLTLSKPNSRWNTRLAGSLNLAVLKGLHVGLDRSNVSQTK
jgi:hypothetical protein